MGVSLYYNASQTTPLTAEQDAAIKTIVSEMAGGIHELLNQDEEGFEDFYVYREPRGEGEVFAGATGLPLGSNEAFNAAVGYWGCGVGNPVSSRGEGIKLRPRLAARWRSTGRGSSDRSSCHPTVLLGWQEVVA